MEAEQLKVLSLYVEGMSFRYLPLTINNSNGAVIRGQWSSSVL